MQLSLELVPQLILVKFLASCRRHVKMLSSRNTLQSWAATWNGLRKISGIVAKVEPSSAANVTQCELFATCVTVTLRDMLQVGCSVWHALLSICLSTFWGLHELHKVVVSSLFCKSYIDFCESYSSRVPMCNMSSATLQLISFSMLRDKLQKETLSCNTS